MEGFCDIVHVYCNILHNSKKNTNILEGKWQVKKYK